MQTNERLNVGRARRLPRRGRVTLASVVVLLACTAAIGFAQSTAANPTEWPTEETWLEIIDDARWAQNAHNVQSWRFRVRGDGALVGGLDPERLLPETDPIGRQLVLSLGNLSEAARKSAEVRGYDLEAEWIAAPDWSVLTDAGADLFVWRLAAPAGGAASSRGAAEGEGLEDHRKAVDALTSPTVKFGLDATEPAPTSLARTIVDRSGPQAKFVLETDTLRVAETLALASTAFAIEMRHTPTLMESYDLTRIGRRERRDTPYGLSLVANFRRGVMWLVDPMTTLFRQSPEEYAETGIKMFERTVAEGRSVVVLTTPGNTPAEWFAAGQPLQAVWADARARGYELLPLSQGIQEYPEVAEQYRRFHELWAGEGETIQMILLVGEPRGHFRRSPRLAAEAFFRE
jgi:nitroreductase